MQASVQRRRDAAAAAIQAAWRGRCARLLLRQLHERRDAADRLVARVLAAAYHGTVGQQRCLARRAAAARVTRWRRWRWRCRQRLHKQLQEPDWLLDETEGGVEPPASGSVEEEQCIAAVPAAVGQQAVPAVAPASPDPPPPPVEASPRRLQRPAAPAACSGQPDSASCLVAADPAPAAAAPALPAAIPSAAEPRRVATPPAALIAATGPVPAAFTAAGSLLPRTASSGGGSSRGGSAGRQLGRQVSFNSSRLPQQACASPPRTAAAPGADGVSGGHGPYRRVSSIQLLEAVQLGVDCAAGSVASQAAMAVCERAQEAARELRSSASLGRRTGTAGGGAGGGHISRASSRVQRQGSRAWGADVIAE